MFFSKFHTIFEYCKAIPFFTPTFQFELSPCRVLIERYVPFGMGHQPEYSAAIVANSGYIIYGTIGVVRIAFPQALIIRVLESYHAVFLKGLQYLFIARYEFPLSVSDRQLYYAVDSLRPDTFRRAFRLR